MAHYKGAASEAGRAAQLMKKREIQQQEIEFRKKKIEEELKLDKIENKFATHYDAVEQQLKSSTIGLVTLDEMKAKQEDIVREREKKLAQKKDEKDREKQRALEAIQAEKTNRNDKYKHCLLIWTKMKRNKMLTRMTRRRTRFKSPSLQNGQNCAMKKFLLKRKKYVKIPMWIPRSYQTANGRSRRIDCASNSARNGSCSRPS